MSAICPHGEHIRVCPACERRASDNWQRRCRESSDTIAALEAENARLSNALDHIARTALRAETSTRRLEWIAQRAREALAGYDYDPRDSTLPTTRTNIVESLRAENTRLREALWKSVKLQSHYALLLNDYDDGKRMTFDSADAWIDRLAALAGKEG